MRVSLAFMEMVNCASKYFLHILEFIWKFFIGLNQIHVSMVLS